VSGRLGDTLEGTGADGCPVAVRVLWLLDPADEFFVAEGIGVPSAQRVVIVALELANLGTADYSAPPDVGLALVDAAGSRYHRATATLTAYPRFRHEPLRPGQGVGGHSYFVLPRTQTVLQVEWSTTGDTDEEVLTWLL